PHMQGRTTGADASSLRLDSLNRVIARDSGRSSNSQQLVGNASLGVTGCPAFAGHDTKKWNELSERSTGLTNGSRMDSLPPQEGRWARAAQPSLKLAPMRPISLPSSCSSPQAGESQGGGMLGRVGRGSAADFGQPTAAVTRWRVSALPSA